MRTKEPTIEVVRGGEPTMTRVTSRDGTAIAYWTSAGIGPPLLLVHGTSGVHERFAPLLPYLEPHVTVHAMDRRGRGGSGDAAVYDLAREFEDVAAAIDAIAETSGSLVDVYGHSFGGNCAFGAALLTSNVRRLVLYEGWPPVTPDKLVYPVRGRAATDALVAAGNREAAVETLMREVVHVPEDELDAIRAQPTWPAWVAAAHTITREIRAFSSTTLLTLRRWAKIAVPVLVLTGSDSSDAGQGRPGDGRRGTRRRAPRRHRGPAAPRRRVLAPELFARHVLAFLHEQQ